MTFDDIMLSLYSRIKRVKTQIDAVSFLVVAFGMLLAILSEKKVLTDIEIIKIMDSK